ncbi:MAG: DUF5686 and carboxypeptidase regulatory-like domain-containing protein [Bacteroidia bacterium]|nr:DUF5686 and carboxypeptidase regulatory-like domain-containing protein [Bacteroidia bacterium]
MMRPVFSLLIFILCFAPSGVFAQAQTIITGTVYDSLTNEPMPFVNIILPGTKAGAVSDIEGKFTIVTTVHADSIRAQYIGYKPTTLPIRNGVKQNINIPLSKNTVALGEIIVYAGENPAHILLRKVWAKKPDNNKEKLDCYQYEAYNKLEFDLNNISEDFQKRKVMKPVSFIFDRIDSTNPTEKPHLPMFFSESISDFYYRKDPKTKKEIIKGSKVSGVEDASISQFTGEMYQDVNIYDNNIILFGKHFVSPMSTNGLLFYKYFLVDSMNVDGHWCYQVQFKPKRKQELLFVGNMWIADSSYAVKRLEMTITEDANLNYVTAFYVIQDYDNVSGEWMLSKEKVVADFALTKRQMGLYGRKTTSYRNVKVNQCKDDEFYTRTENLIVEEGAEKRDSVFWAQARHDTLSRTEQGIYDMVDSVQNLPVYRTWENIMITAYSGYKIIGPFEFGPWYKTVSGNQIEGVRFRLGGRTSNAFSKWVEFSGYAAYGTKDEEFKYNFGFKSFITKKPRQLVGVNYKNDYEILGQSNNAFTSDNLLASIFRRNPLNNMTRVEQYEVWYERDWFTGFNMRLSLVNRNMYALNDTAYYHLMPSGAPEYHSSIQTSEVRANFRFAWDEKYIEGVFSRVSMGTRYPVVQVQYVAGLKGVFNSDYTYHRVSINVDDRIRINPIGYTNYILEAGKIFGTVPYPLMILHPGNETYVYDWASFNMMNYYEFASDQYAMATLIHHFDGFFLNKIPLMRKLKWREVASFRAVYGSVSNSNKDALVFPSTLYSLNRGPYMEAGAGIENIFRFFRVDCFWRLTYLDNPRVKPVGVRISLQVLF